MQRTPTPWLVMVVASLACLAGCQGTATFTPPPATPTVAPVHTSEAATHEPEGDQLRVELDARGLTERKYDARGQRRAVS